MIIILYILRVSFPRFRFPTDYLTIDDHSLAAACIMYAIVKYIISGLFDGRV